ncbi:MAG: hypothetical protein KW788_03370 [Candidatus Doudnabacteria bacterium]|nr:hypothetical protein [Candidatus Doudnabacteria bacterium]
MENKKIIWTAQEFKVHKKPVVWYVAFAIVAVGLIAYAIYNRNILTLLTFVLLVITGFFLAHQKPRQMQYELNTTGVVLGQITYPYRNIKKFWIIYTPENKSVNFETIAYINNQISMELGRQNPLVIKQFLKNYLQEDLNKEESFTDILARRIKF